MAEQDIKIIFSLSHKITSRYLSPPSPPFSPHYGSTSWADTSGGEGARKDPKKTAEIAKKMKSGYQDTGGGYDDSQD